jgi:arylsulfatase A
MARRVVGGAPVILLLHPPPHMIRNLLLFALALATASPGIAAAPARPNIVFILADDMGWGDPHCFNADSKIATPHIDQIATQGMRFTDAHAAGSVCVPSRYALLTGRYPFRNTGFRNPVKGALIQPDRPTVATVLRGAGYATAMVGKWHLGFDGGDQFDYSQPLRGGPVDHGFDSFFGQHASLDIPPYFFIANDRCVEPASETIAASSSPDWTPVQGAFWRGGKISPSFKHIEALPIYTRKAVEYVESRAQGSESKPFFLYVAFTAPHTPWLPTEAFRGKSLGGLYGDFVTQVDDAVGQVLAALDRAKLSDNTLVFFTSDNGPMWYPEDVKKFGHSAAGPWRGMKGDAWEAGHRMPFIARWPGKVPSGATNTETICFSDIDKETQPPPVGLIAIGNRRGVRIVCRVPCVRRPAMAANDGCPDKPANPAHEILRLPSSTVKTLCLSALLAAALPFAPSLSMRMSRARILPRNCSLRR